MRNPTLRSGVYPGMRSVPLFLISALVGMAQPRPEPLDAAIQAVWQARTEGRFADATAARQQARDLLQRVPLDSPQFEGWVMQVAQLYQSSGMNLQGRAVVEEAIARTAPLGDRFPARAGLLYAIAELWWDDGNLLKAAGYLERAAAANPATAEYARLAELYRQLGRPEAMSAAIIKLQTLPGGAFEAAQFYEQHEQFDQAAQLYRDLAAKSDQVQEKSAAWMALASLEEGREHYSAAADATQQAIAAVESAGPAGAHGQTVWMRQSLARDLARTGKASQGDQIFQQLLRETQGGPDETQMETAYAQYLSGTNRASQAESVLKEYLASGAAQQPWQQATVLNSLSAIAGNQGNGAAAESYRKAAQALQPAPHSPQSPLAIADLVGAAQKAMAEHRTDDVYNLAKQALDFAAQAPDGEQVVWLVSQAAGDLAAGKRTASAEQLFQKLFTVVEAWREENMHPLLEARENYIQFLANQPDRAGDEALAIERYRDALIEVNGAESGTMAEPLRLQLRLVRKVDQAAADLLALQESLSGSASERYLSDLEQVAQAFQEAGNMQRALVCERKAVGLADQLGAPDRSELRMQMAWILLSLNQREEAINVAEQAVALSPDNHSLSEQLEQIRRAGQARPPAPVV